MRSLAVLACSVALCLCLIIPGGPVTARAAPLQQGGGCSQQYVIRAGDTLYRIGVNFNTSVGALQRLNAISDPSVIRIGTTVCVKAGPALPGAAPLPLRPLAWAPAQVPAPAADLAAVPEDSDPNTDSSNVAESASDVAAAVEAAEAVVDAPDTVIDTADAVVNTQRLNVRGGPSTAYQVIGGVSLDEGLTVTGKNDANTWLEIETDEIEEGWVFTDLTVVNVDLADVPVAEAPPEPTPVPVVEKPAEEIETAAAAAPPVAVAAPAPSGYRGFGYGVQAHMMDANLNQIFDMINGMGFNWVKQQVEWFRIEPHKGQYNWGALDAIVDTANARGVNVLFSVVKAPEWARPGNTDRSVEGPPANPQDFAEFMGAMAGRYRGRVPAYEVWNEQNLWYEWGGEPIDAGRYVRLLAAVYGAVKAADPGALVISGAPTPTGVTSNIAMDDALYLEQMYQAGLRAYSDGIGVHPSGYNNPPNASAGSWNDPSAPSFKGHRSFFFRDTLWTYYSIMQRYGDGGKKLWPTEFGWASVEGLGVGPAEGYGYAGDNSAGEQAQYLVQAFQLARSWGFVGPMFVWNLNFAPVSGPADEKAAFGILDAGWGARPAYHALRDMGK